MNREIKFRGQRENIKEFIIGFLIEGFNDTALIMKECTYGEHLDQGGDAYGRFYKVITETVGQFTGLKDHNGKEIYEGDLISFGDVYWGDDGMPDIKEIVFDEDSASFRVYDYLELQGSSLAEKWYIDDIIDCIEVIGNIHDNPELLKYL